jgi:hypothetical protein
MKTLLVALLLPWTAHAADKVCAPPGLFKAVTSMEAPDVPEGHFFGVPKTLYRSGDKLGRVEEAKNPQTGLHLLVVVSDPDVWIVDLAGKRGRYVRDPGPTYIFRARIFSEGTVKSAFIRAFEIGCELQWLREAGAKSAATTHAKLGKVNRLEFSEGAESLVVFERSGRPLRMEFLTEGKLVLAMNYHSYETGLQAQPALFARPQGIPFEMPDGK